jgi:putative addiction module component (TIGR02574 family)
MDLESVLTEVETWPVEDRLRLLEELQDRLADHGDALELTEDLKATLDRRLAALDADPQNVTTWEAIRAHVRRPR